MHTEVNERGVQNIAKGGVDAANDKELKESVMQPRSNKLFHGSSQSPLSIVGMPNNTSSVLQVRQSPHNLLYRNNFSPIMKFFR